MANTTTLKVSRAKDIQAELRSLGSPTIAAHARRFFKTGNGEYGEGDRFLGVRVPVVRKLVKKHREAQPKVVLDLLRSAYHEERLFAVLSLVDRFERGTQAPRDVYNTYMDNLQCVNNWDLVDCSAHKIAGRYLQGRSRRPLYRLAKSQDLWKRRVAIISTAHFIRQRDIEDTLAISDILLNDEHDLIHKAVGWMLREVGNRDRKTEEVFLRTRYRQMPRTMLRYAIEKFPDNRRKQYLAGKIR